MSTYIGNSLIFSHQRIYNHKTCLTFSIVSWLGLGSSLAPSPSTYAMEFSIFLSHPNAHTHTQTQMEVLASVSLCVLGPSSSAVVWPASEWMTLNWNAITWPGHALRAGLQRQQQKQGLFRPGHGCCVCRSNVFGKCKMVDYSAVVRSPGSWDPLAGQLVRLAASLAFCCKLFGPRLATPPQLQLRVPASPCASLKFH